MVKSKANKLITFFYSTVQLDFEEGPKYNKKVVLMAEKLTLKSFYFRFKMCFVKTHTKFHECVKDPKIAFMVIRFIQKLCFRHRIFCQYRKPCF